MSATKTYLLQCLAFVAILIALIFVAGIGMKQFATTFDQGEKKVLEITSMKGKKYDVLFMGNSLVNQSVIPTTIDSILNTNSYNMGLGGANYLSMELLLNDYLQHNEKPKYIVYGIFINHTKKEKYIRPSILKEVAAPTLSYYHDYLKKQNKNREYTIELYNQFSLFRYRGSLKFAAYALKGNQPYPMIKGFPVKTMNYNGVNHYPKHKAYLDIDQLNAFGQYCKKQHIKLILFEPPNSIVYNESVSNRQEILDLIYSSEAFDDNLIFLNDDVSYLDQKMDYGNLNHLNYNGAKKFTLKLARALREHIKL
jgi:hypothetical protein